MAVSSGLGRDPLLTSVFRLAVCQNRDVVLVNIAVNLENSHIVVTIHATEYYD